MIDTDTELIESLGLVIVPPCEGNNHHKWGEGEVIAYVTIKTRCCPEVDHKFICAGCLGKAFTIPSAAICSRCRTVERPFSAHIREIKYL